MEQKGVVMVMEEAGRGEGASPGYGVAGAGHSAWRKPEGSELVSSDKVRRLVVLVKSILRLGRLKMGEEAEKSGCLHFGMGEGARKQPEEGSLLLGLRQAYRIVQMKLNAGRASPAGRASTWTSVYIGRACTLANVLDDWTSVQVLQLDERASSPGRASHAGRASPTGRASTWTSVYIGRACTLANVLDDWTSVHYLNERPNFWTSARTSVLDERPPADERPISGRACAAGRASHAAGRASSACWTSVLTLDERPLPNVLYALDERPLHAGRASLLF
ncbi:hypothetical protein LR48_Vigan03g006900 [Vigna angularis]|uniref:Uncharacterized protein n=1 Tax=Phaseolus angularis TaxID=3914 RepID=A0A0L9U1I7_PHAAN|nr:hypothetical protein LR48_Vigan03g006900 [Vigna angularis]